MKQHSVDFWIVKFWKTEIWQGVSDDLVNFIAYCCNLKVFLSYHEFLKLFEMALAWKNKFPQRYSIDQICSSNLPVSARHHNLTQSTYSCLKPNHMN